MLHLQLHTFTQYVVGPTDLGLSGRTERPPFLLSSSFCLRRDLHLPINPSPVAPREISRNLIGIQSFYDFPSAAVARLHKIKTHVDFLSFRHTTDSEAVCCWTFILTAVLRNWPFTGTLLLLFFFVRRSLVSLLLLLLLFLPPTSHPVHWWSFLSLRPI